MFALTWRPFALDQLSDIYVGQLAPDERDRVAAQVEQLNRDLIRDALEVGESRNEPVRVVLLADVTVYFTVVAYRVQVVRVHRRN